jgi:hypothetical protein
VSILPQAFAGFVKDINDRYALALQSAGLVTGGMAYPPHLSLLGFLLGVELHRIAFAASLQPARHPRPLTHPTRPRGG